MATKRPAAGKATTAKAAGKATTARSAGRATSARTTAKDRSENFPPRIFALASPVSQAGVSLFTPGLIPDSSNYEAFASPDDLIERCMNLLADSGFEVLQATQLMINIAGPRELYESVFSTQLYTEERLTVKSRGVEEPATFIDSVDTDVSGLILMEGTRFEGLLEGVAIEAPAYPDTPNAFPPPVDYWHLDVPADVSLGINADKAHRSGITGLGVTVAMVDTGFQSHPFFTDRGYRVDPTVLGPGTADPTIDENGHGTGESANIFAAAPDVLLKPVKIATASGALVNVTAAVNAAAALGPDIITNSWGSSLQFPPIDAARQALAAAVAAAVANGITVVFSAGNGGWGFPGQHPDVISAGGVFMQQNGALQASDYASGFDSNVYPGRRVPDVSGLVGMRPGAQYIMLPVPEGSALDTLLAGGSHPNGDETPNNDGWAAFSGTSAAAPQIAGVCALIRQACGRLGPAEIRDILMTTARDVTTGTNHPNFGNAAVVGPDNATGNGLVDAHKAVLIAKLRCSVVPVIPFRPPFGPVVPFKPPLLPFTPPLLPFKPPLLPFKPPFGPVVPFKPPLLPFRPPFGPIPPIEGPIDQGRPGETAAGQNVPGSVPVTPEDLAEIERIIIESPDQFDR